MGLGPGTRIALALLSLPLGAAEAGERRELQNRSSQPWRLCLVEGLRPHVGQLAFMDKFTGQTLAVLARTGDAITLPPGAHLVVTFTRVDGYAYHNFLLQDRRGYYAEFLCTVEFRSSPRLTFSLRDQHVGPPLDRADEGTLALALQDAIDTRDGALVIRQDGLGGPT